jgi:Putative Flp pilus-assembly TadE/G-like
MRLNETRRRDESGAYAVMFGFLAVVLLGMSALAVDLGNAVARKSDAQGQADFAALAGGAELDNQTSGTIPNTVLSAVRDYLNQNDPLDAGCTGPCVANNAQLTNGNYADGEVVWSNGGLRVFTPEDQVDYGFAGIFGVDEKQVQGDATVGVFSPGNGALPMYAVSGCDYGVQTIKDPAGQEDPDVASGLEFPAHTNATTDNPGTLAITSPSDSQIDLVSPPAAVTELVSVHSSNGTFTKTNGNDRSHYTVTKIGFFKDTTVVEVPVVGVNANDAWITTVPASVAGTEGIWWIRVYVEGTAAPTDVIPMWSAMDKAVPFRVGIPELECDAGSSDGNFGTLTLPRTDVVSADDLPVNIAESFQKPLTLAIHDTVAANGECTEGVSGAIVSGDPNPGLMPGTNCVDTLTGLRSNDATSGFISGLSTSKGFVAGRLNAEDGPTNPDCGRSDYTIDLGPNDYLINNDTLSCFLTDSGNLTSITSPTYNSGARLNEDIYDSPRFFFMPVLDVEASSGGSGRYSIIDFRAGFITSETEFATKASSDATDDNGLITHANLVSQVKVIFFNQNALPSSTDGAVSDYLGVGPKILRLID